MIDGIRQNLSYLEPGARKGAKADGAKSASSSSASSSTSGAIGAEIVEISASGQAAVGAPLDRKKIDEEILPRYVDGLMVHWRESVEDEIEKALFARIDAGEKVTPQEIAADRLLWGTPDDVIDQIERYRKEILGSRLMTVFGVWQADVATGGQVMHLVARRVVDHTPMLGELTARSRDFR
jgi:predicted transcriptional regulator